MILLQENQSMISFDHFLPSQGFIFNSRKLAHFFQVSIQDFNTQRFPVSLNFFGLLLFQALKVERNYSWSREV